MKTFIKKCFIVFIFATSFMFLVGNIIHIGNKEYTYIDYQILYNLDYPQTQLNNHSLREVFEDNIFQQNLTGTRNTSGSLFYKIYSNKTLNYIRIRLDYTGNLGNIFYSSVESPTLTNRSNNITTNIINKGYYSIIQDDYDYKAFNLYLQNPDVTINLLTHYRVPLIELGIDYLTIEQMDYWFEIYNTLKGLE
ncbi:MAG: hypothetical protein QXW48_04475 [Thermoplasmata archaeon]